MFKDSRYKMLLMECRTEMMKMMKFYLEKFKETKEEVYWERAEIFGNHSKDYKKKIEDL